MQKTLHFIHGSGATPENPKEFAFELFDYVYDVDSKTANLPGVKSGLDAHGPGIYAFGAKTTDKINKTKQKYADSYSSENGSVIGFQLTMEERDGRPLKLINQYRADTIPVEDWAEVIESFTAKARLLQGFDRDRSMLEAETFSERWPDMMHIFADGTQKMSESGLSAWRSIVAATAGLIDSYASPDNFRDPRSFLRAFEESLDMADPMSRVLDEGGSYAIAEYAIESADNLWDTLKKIYFTVAVQQKSASRYLSMNQLFQQTVLSELPQAGLLKVAAVEQGNFFVVFDTKAITVDAIQIHQLQPQSEEDVMAQVFAVMSPYSTVKEKMAAVQAWSIDNTGHAISKDAAKLLAESPSATDLTLSKKSDIAKELRTEYRHYERYDGAIDEYMPALKQPAVVLSPSEPLVALLSKMDQEWLQSLAAAPSEPDAMHHTVLGAEVTMSWCEGRTAELSLRSPVQLSPVCLMQGTHGQPLLRPWGIIEPERAAMCADIEKLVTELNFAPGRQSLEQLAETIQLRHGEDGLWVLGSYFVATDSAYIFQNGVHCYDLAQMSAARVEHRAISHTPLGQSIAAKMAIATWDARTLHKAIQVLPVCTLALDRADAAEIKSPEAPSYKALRRS